MSVRTIKNLGRRTLRQLCRLGLLVRSRPLQFLPGDCILILAPHSDDETLGCGALLADLVTDGYTVHVAYFTDSGGSHRHVPGIDAHVIATQRQAEATAAMELAGIPAQCLHWLGAPDGRLKQLSPAECIHWQSRLGALLTEVRPTVVLLPSRADGSSEHEAMFRLFAGLVSSLSWRPRVLEFPIWAWWNPRFLRPQVRATGRIWRHSTARQAARKRAMLACYCSQVQALPPTISPPLSPEFLAAFSTSHEFFFETNLPS